MSSIIVTRGLGDRQGADISETLLTSETVQINRGRAEIDKNSTDRVKVAMSGGHIGYIPPCSLVQVNDSGYGSYRGVVDQCTERFVRTSLTEFNADTDLVIEREEV